MKYARLLNAAKAWVKRYPLVSLLVIVIIGALLFVGGVQSRSALSVNSSKSKSSAKTSLLGEATGTATGQPTNATQNGNAPAASGGSNTGSTNKTTKPNTSANGANNSFAPLQQVGASATMILSSNSITLHKLSATDGGTAQLTITSSDGAITQPTSSNYQKTVALENTSTPPYPTIFRTQWTYTLKRIENSLYGSDGIDFTAQSRSGKTITAHLNVTIEPIPSFTVAKGPLTHVANPDGTVTYTAHLIINPGPYFGNPQLHMCIMDYNYLNQCNVSQDFTYNGNNDLSMSRTITPSAPGTGYFDITLFIDGWYTNGSAKISWHENY